MINASRRRKDCTGLLGLVGIASTRARFFALHNPLHKQYLRYVLTGSIDHASRLYKANLVSFPICPFRLTSQETAQHVFWECVRWKTIRETFPKLLHFLFFMAHSGPNAAFTVDGLVYTRFRLWFSDVE